MKEYCVYLMSVRLGIQEWNEQLWNPDCKAKKPAPSRSKIGFTGNVSRRRNAVSFLAKHEVTLDAEIPCDSEQSARALERKLHAMFKDKALPEAEWFTLDQDDINRFMEIRAVSLCAVYAH